MPAIRLCYIAAVCFFAASKASFADTLSLRNGDEIKGLVLRDYKDRVVVSTADGEKTLMKKDLCSVSYDSEANALYKEAGNYEKKREYIKAYHTYEKALELDPEMELARDRMIYLNNFIGKKFKHDFFDKVYRNMGQDEPGPGVKLSDKVFDELGIQLKPGQEFVEVGMVREDAGKFSGASLRVDDKIIAVWGRMAAYMDSEEVSAMLLEPGEIKMTVERKYAVTVPERTGFPFYPLRTDTLRRLGGEVVLKKTGFIVNNVVSGTEFCNAGIRKGDIICNINGMDVKYTPYSGLEKVLGASRGKNVDIVVRRDVSLWKKEELDGRL